MRPILFVLFAILASSCRSSEVESHEESVNLIDLDEKALYLIIWELNFADTLSTAKVHPVLSDVANQVFRDKNSAYELNVMSHLLSTHMNYRPVRDYEFGVSGPIRVNNFPTALSILEHFGSSIEKISIDFNFIKSADRKLLTSYLHKYASKTVKQLNLRPINQANLNEMKTPFAELEDLTVLYHSRRSGSSSRWSKLFPKLKRLSLSLSYKSGFSLIDTEFPHLKHLGLRVSKGAWRKAEHIENLIKNNPTIDSVELDATYTPEFVKLIIETLPKLQSLKLHSWNVGDDAIQFDNVKNFVVGTSNAKSIEKLSLPQLETLEMQYSPRHAEKWTEFFNQHSHLTQLTMVESFTQHILPLNDFTAALPNLRDVTLLYTTKISCDEIIKFIDSHEKLTQFSFAYQILEVLVKEFETDTQTLRTRYENSWTITDFGYEGNKGLMFQKKTE